LGCPPRLPADAGRSGCRRRYAEGSPTRQGCGRSFDSTFVGAAPTFSPRHHQRCPERRLPNRWENPRRLFTTAGRTAPSAPLFPALSSTSAGGARRPLRRSRPGAPPGRPRATDSIPRRGRRPLAATPVHARVSGSRRRGWGCGQPPSPGMSSFDPVGRWAGCEGRRLPYGLPNV